MVGKNIFVFIDESGDLGENGSKYLVICALWVEDPAILERLMKKVRKQKRFERYLKKTHELHANASADDLCKYVLQEIGNNQEIHAYGVVLDKRKHLHLLKGNKHTLYNYVCGDLAMKWNIPNHHLIIRIDKSKGKSVLRDNFNEYFRRCLKQTGRTNEPEIYHSHSHAWHGLQFVDFISWALFRKFELNDNTYFELVEKQTGIGHVWDKSNHGRKSSGTHQY